jgi:glutamate-ammonia-ligase adenylyltransferase
MRTTNRTAPSPDDIADRLLARNPALPPDLVRDFVRRMDPDYFERFDPDATARHASMLACLEPDHPCRTFFADEADGRLALTVVAYDYFAEFALICGLLTAFGLDIREGRIYTFHDTAAPPRGRPRARAGLDRKKIVDVFRVAPLDDVPFDLSRRREFSDELGTVVRLLGDRRLHDARNHINRRLTERLSRNRTEFSGLLLPIQVRFDNAGSSPDTVIDIRSTDTPAFLYAFANALALRGLDIRKAWFENLGEQVHDRFFVRNRSGGRIESRRDQDDVRLTATLVKQFTHFLTWAPDPAKAMSAFDRFVDRYVSDSKAGLATQLLRDRTSMALLARLLGTSDFLWEDFLRRQHAHLGPLLRRYEQAPLLRSRSRLTRAIRRRMASARSDRLRRSILNRFKDETLFHIDMTHLLDAASTLPDFSLALTNLAEVVVEQAYRDSLALMVRAHGWPRTGTGALCGGAVFGMGKFGGQELGYASDIELLFAYESSGRSDGRRPLGNGEFFERLAQDLLGRIEAKQEGIFHIDVRLRPHGSQSVLVNPLDELRAYYSPAGACASFERQALIKLRFVAGDAALGRAVERHRDAFVYSRERWDVPNAVALRMQQIAERSRPDQTNVKYSPGGLIDIEYAVQYLQLMHGHEHPGVRSVNTLQALAALQTARLIDEQDAGRLRDAYLFLRTVIDGLRIVRGHAKDLVLPPQSSEAFIYLARRLGYMTEDWQAGAAAFADHLRQHMRHAREFFRRRFESGAAD